MVYFLNWVRNKTIYVKNKYLFTYLKKLSIVFWFFLFVPFSIIIIIYSVNNSNTIKSNIISDYDTRLSSLAEEYGNFLSDIDKKFDFLLTYSQISKVLYSNEKQSALMNIETQRNINEVIVALLGADYRMNLCIYTENDNIYIPKYFDSINKISVMNYYSDLLSLSPSKTYYAIKKTDKEYFCAYRRFIGLKRLNDIIEISIPYSDILKMYDFKIPLNSQLHIYLNDYDFFDLSIPENQNLLTKYKNGTLSNNYLYLEKDIYTYGKIHLFVSDKVYSNKIRNIFIMSLLSILVTGILIILVSKVTAKIMTKRLNMITEMIMSDSAIQENYDGKQKDEFDMIADKIIEYSNFMKEKNKRELIEKKERLSLELMLLQERISPHFLYNTLASIKWVYKDKRLGSIIDSMVKYYRVALNKGSNLIRIKDELSGINEYLKLQMFSYGKTFNIEINCEESLYEVKVLKNMLQPIVENAFLHGINLLPDKMGEICVNVYTENNDIVFIIENNGPPISEESLLKIFNSCDSNSISNEGGYALRNIIKRIHLYYGSQYGLKISNERLTKVEVKIPLKCKREDESNNV